MPIITSNKECRLPLGEIFVEGVESGLVDDLKYRPNKYFQLVEDIRLEDRHCIIRYQKEFSPVEGNVTLLQIKQLLAGVLDAMQRQARDQTFYLYPGTEAFGLNRRQSLRIGLINAKPQSDIDRSPQELCVDAFLKLIADHCPEAHKKIVRYNKPVMTLRHLEQLLDQKGVSPLFMGIVSLFVLGAAGFVILHQFGPPRIKQSLRQWTTHLKIVGKRVIRSGSDEWFAQLGEERQKNEYRFEPAPLTLLIQPNTPTPELRQALYQFLAKLLGQELPKSKYQLLIPHPSLSPKVYERWQTLCKHVLNGSCKPNSWLLHVPKYRGGIRPLLEGIREAMRKSSGGLSVSTKYHGFVASVELKAHHVDKKNSPKPQARTTNPKTPNKENPTAPNTNPLPKTKTTPVNAPKINSPPIPTPRLRPTPPAP